MVISLSASLVNGHGGVVQYDFGKSTPSGFERTGFLNALPTVLLAAVTKLRSNLDRGRSSLSSHLSRLDNIPKFGRNQAGSDTVRCESGATASTLRSVFLAYHQETLEHIGNSPRIIISLS